MNMAAECCLDDKLASRLSARCDSGHQLHELSSWPLASPHPSNKSHNHRYFEYKS